MNWFFIALGAPILWSITNHFDKYLVGKYFKGGSIGSLVIFSSLIALPILPLIYVFNPQVLELPLKDILILCVSGSIFILGLIPYLYALEKEEASVVVPLFQIIPLFSYLLGYVFLKETLTLTQVIASLLIISGSIIISLEFVDARFKLKKQVLGLMILASFLCAVNSLLFKYVAITSDFWTTSFWEYMGYLVVAAIILICIRPYRRQFIHVVRSNSVAVIGLNMVNEVLNIAGKLCFTYASLLAPLTLTWVVNGFQPFFVFLFGVIITLLFPKFGAEKLSKHHILQKVIAILIIFLGGYLLQ